MSNWDLIPLKHIGRINPEVLGEDVSPDHEMLYVDIGSVGQGRLTADPQPMLFDEAPSRARRVLRQGDSIVSTVRTYLRSAWFVRECAPGLIASTGFMVIRPHAKFDEEFVGWAVQSDSFIDDVVSKSVGVSYPAITSTEMSRIKIPVPPLPEQRRVAEYLGQETSQIDCLIEEYERQIALVEEVNDALLDELLIDGQIEFDECATPVGIAGVPMRPLRAAAQVRGGVTVDGKRKLGPEAVEVAYLRVANVQDGFLDLGEVKTIRLPPDLALRNLLASGDVLLTEGGDPDKLGRGTVFYGEPDPCVHQNHVFSVRPSERVHPEYLALVTRSSYGKAYFEATGTQTTGIATTNKNKVKSFRIPDIPFEEQESIVEKLKLEVAGNSRVTRELLVQIEHLQEFRRAIITTAVTEGVDACSAL